MSGKGIRAISIDREELKRAERDVVIDGVKAVMGISSFSTPRELTARFEPADKPSRITLEFRYNDAEPSASAPFDYNGISIVQGKYSRKILSIRAHIDQRLDGPGLEKLTRRIAEALKQRRKAVFEPPRVAGAGDFLNQDVVEEVLENEENRRRLGLELVGAG